MTRITTHRTRLMNTLKQFGLLFITVASSQSAAIESEENPWYEVNMVIFSLSTNSMGSESWQDPELLDLRFPSTTINMDKDSPMGLAFSLRSPSDKDFRQSLSRIKNSPNYTVLVEKSWLQPGYDKRDALPILIQGGEKFGDKESGEYYALEGTITLSLSRYLHFQANLWFSEYEMRSIATDSWWNDTEQALPTNDNMIGSDILSHETIPMSAPNPDEQITRLRAVKTVVMNESRRMRSGELHYLDHPLFGILVKVNTYEPPVLPVIPSEEGESTDTQTEYKPTAIVTPVESIDGKTKETSSL